MPVLFGFIEAPYRDRYNFQSRDEKTVSKGVLYFGFCNWSASRGDLEVSGSVAEPTGFKRRFNNSNSDWDQWPIRVTAPLVSGH